MGKRQRFHFLIIYIYPRFSISRQSDSVAQFGGGKVLERGQFFLSLISIGNSDKISARLGLAQGLKS